MEAKHTFNHLADEYNISRPTYPTELFKDIIVFSKVKPDAKILEIGCGTGQATQGFIKEGYKNITCIEIGDNLADFTRKKFKQIKSVQVHHSSFEEWQGEDSDYDLAISATAFHFIDPNYGYNKVANLLNKSGTSAFFWTIHVVSYEDIYNEIREAYQKHAPKLNDATIPTPEEAIEKRVQIMKSTNTLQNITVKKYFWDKTYTSDQYVALLNTHSGHQLLPPSKREQLFSDIKKIINKYNGFIQKKHMVALFLAKTK